MVEIAPSTSSEIALLMLSSGHFGSYVSVCDGRDTDCVKRIVNVAKKVGGSELVAEMVTAQDGRALKGAVRQNDQVTAHLVFNVLTDEQKEKINFSFRFQIGLSDRDEVGFSMIFF